MDFQKICDTLQLCPNVAGAFAHADVVRYIEIMEACFNIADETAKLAWAIFGDLVCVEN
jgi:hypothetical protein